MKGKSVLLVSFLLLVAIACSSTNQGTKQLDDKAIADAVRSKIAQAVPGNPSVDVKVNHQVVILTGHAASEEDRRKIADAAQSVSGVTTVINNITLQP